MKTLKVILTVLPFVVLSACSTNGLLTSTEPQQTIYSLRSVEPSGESSDMMARVIEITAPSLPPGMQQDRIALYLNDGQKLDYYAAARWAAPLDMVLHDFTRRSASAVLPYVVAVTPEQGIDSQYKLQVKVNEFQPVYGTDSSAAPLLKVNVEFTLIKLPEDRIIRNFSLSRSEVAPENRLDVIVMGLESLLQSIEREAFGKMNEHLQKK